VEEVVPNGLASFFVTTCERKNGFLLIDVFRKLINAQNYGHWLNVGRPFVFMQTTPVCFYNIAF
jgi:hypothetical protein